MKQKLLALRARIDATSVRERVMMFCAAAGTIVFLLFSLMLNPLLLKQKQLREQIASERNDILRIDAEITTTVVGYANDPDQDNRRHLAALKAEAAALGDSLRAMEHGLIAPERMAPLLEQMLKSNGRLRLMGLKTLPVSVLNERSADSEPKAEPAAKAVPVLYRHGVELSVRGNYLDLVNYMDALEAMPARLFWGTAQLEVEEYPNARLTLNLYTLSLDQNWMKL